MRFSCDTPKTEAVLFIDAIKQSIASFDNELFTKKCTALIGVSPNLNKPHLTCLLSQDGTTQGEHIAMATCRLAVAVFGSEELHEHFRETTL